MELNDWLDIILEYLKVLAWPIIVFVLALLYRRPLIGVLERLRKATGWGASLELEQQVRELAHESAELAIEAESPEPTQGPETSDTTPPLPENPPETPVVIEPPALTLSKYEWRDDSAHAAQLSPAFVDHTTHTVWRLLEKEALNIAADLGLPLGGHLSIIQVLSELSKRHLIDPDTIGVAASLHNVRNRIQRESGLTFSSAALDSFVETTNNLISIIQSASAKVRKRAQNDPGTQTRP